MNDRNLLNQAEIDALLNAASGSLNNDEPADSPGIRDLSLEEMDALGEIGNISMGAASTTLSELLGKRVNITSPKIRTCMQQELFSSFDIPFIVIQVEFRSGIQGFNVLIMHLQDAMRMANLMMGGDGSQTDGDVTEMELSAASEAMNQMIGTASTSLATMFGRAVNISPPRSVVVQADDAELFRLPAADPVVVVSFNMSMGDLLDTEIMQIMSLETAREEASLLLSNLLGIGPGHSEAAVIRQSEEPLPEPEPLTEVAAPSVPEVELDYSGGDQESWNGFGRERFAGATAGGKVEIDQSKLEMLMDIPLKVSVILGRTRRQIKDVLTFTPGSIVELSAVIDEPVEVMVNGTLVARGEVVVVNENFGVRITEIISPRERLRKVMS
jgi:flagellar motor switch protein FliN/FliY